MLKYADPKNRSPVQAAPPTYTLEPDPHVAVLSTVFGQPVMWAPIIAHHTSQFTLPNDCMIAADVMQLANAHWLSAEYGFPYRDIARNALAWDRLFRTLQAWRALPDGWDGAAAKPPSLPVFREAFHFLGAARSADVPAPAPHYAADGEIDFRWKKGDGFATVAFLHDGTLNVYARLPDVQAAAIDYDGPHKDELLGPHLFQLLRFFG